jgi:Transposase DDE domain
MGHLPRCHDLLHHLTVALSGVATSFARMRRWSPRSVVVAVMLLTRPDQRTSYASVLTDLALESCRALGAVAATAKSSLSVARKKVPVAVFRQVLQRLVDHLGAVLPGRLAHYGDRRFFALDATSLVCPRCDSTLRDLDAPSQNPWLFAHYPRALVVVAFDVVRRLPLDWVLLAKGAGERAAVAPLLSRFRRGDVLILDRGYPARWLLELLVRQGIDVVMRMTAAKAGAWPEVKRFLASGAKTAVIDCRLPDGSTATVRVIKRPALRGRPLKHQRRETMVILTTLLPKHGFEANDIIDLYGKRWGIETLFREMKEAFAIERFHARSTEGIQQEIAAVLMWVALTSAIHAAVEEGLTDGKRANRTVSREIARVSLAAALSGGAMVNLHAGISEARRHAYKPRPGRSFPRVSKLPFGRWERRGIK